MKSDFSEIFGIYSTMETISRYHAVLQALALGISRNEFLVLFGTYAQRGEGGLHMEVRTQKCPSFCTCFAIFSFAGSFYHTL